MSIEDKIREMASMYASQLVKVMKARDEEMDDDDKSHYLIYQVLGISNKEGHLIDLYQNKGRFLYRYAGTFLENAAKTCLRTMYPTSASARIANTRGQRPKTFEIDCLVGADAIEIKWRDATTDGDHITKEHTRIRTIADKGYKPIRVMFYYPNRGQAIKIQQAIETLYNGVGGEYHYGNAAWKFIFDRTGVNLLGILEKIARENVSRS